MPPPPMGWSSWNSLGEGVNHDVIKDEADGLAALNTHITSGARYEYVNIDEGWWRSGQRDERGNLIVDTTQWPGGMQAIARYIHGKRLKAGIYIDAGPRGCGKRADGTHFVGSDFAHYDHDFLQFALICRKSRRRSARRAFQNQRRRTHDAVESLLHELTVKSVAARARFVDDADVSRLR